MTVLLRRPDDLPEPGTWGFWFAVTGTETDLDPARKLPGLPQRLEAAFVAERDTWWSLGRELAGEPGADVAHMPTAGSFGSDFGIMLAWSRLTAEAASGAETHLVVCDDPWVFRHLAGLPGVEAGSPPPMFLQAAKRRVRGFLARTKVALTAALTALRLKLEAGERPPGETVLLVYGHPVSRPDGHDAYFGDLMRTFPDLRRLLHTDCPADRALELAGGDGRTGSLHAFGNPLFAVLLPFVRWRPGRRFRTGPLGWLVRRSAAIENGGGGPAMNRWQAHCQTRWLKRARPARVVWPWENHGWERNLCRAARRSGVRTIGYQHTVIGPHQFNYATATNPDGLESIPDVVVADGPAYRDEMAAWGVPDDRLAVGGAFRITPFEAGLSDPKGPVFVPLSAVPAVARTQVAAARVIAGRGRRVLVKEHPMYPCPFEEEENLTRTEAALAMQRGLSAVLYASGASGLEAVLMGVPAFRLMPDDRIAIDVLPAGFATPTVTLETAAERILRKSGPPEPVAYEEILAEPDMTFWKELLFGDIHQSNASYAQPEPSP